MALVYIVKIVFLLCSQICVNLYNLHEFFTFIASFLYLCILKKAILVTAGLIAQFTRIRNGLFLILIKK